MMDKMPDKEEEKTSKEPGQKEVKVDKKLVQIIIDSTSDVSLDDFQKNDKKILSVLNQDSAINENQYSFNGLARKLGLHQQSLARSLHRLEQAGLVKKTDFGYALAKNLDSVLVKKSRIDLEHLSKKISTNDMEQIIQLYIPNTVSVEDVINKLLGRWFGTLRWVGIIQSDNGHVLQWTSNEKYHVNLKIVSRYAVVESDAIGAQKSEAIMDAHKIIGHITKLLKDNQFSDLKNSTRYFSYN